MWWFVLACVHTPPHPPVPGDAEVRVVRRTQLVPDGAWCDWEAEEMVYEGQPLWHVDPPDQVEGNHNEAWCARGGEQSRTVDRRGQDGAFLSTLLREERCCPRESVVECVTWDLRTRAPARLSDYDPRRAERRWQELTELRAHTPALAGWDFRPDSFLVEGGHVWFCGIRAGSVREVRVR